MIPEALTLWTLNETARILRMSKPKLRLEEKDGRIRCLRFRRVVQIERGYVEPRSEELSCLERALDELIEAKEPVKKVAAQVGWPVR